MIVRKIAPGSVTRSTMWPMCSAVFDPGLMPGMKPPCFFRFSDRSAGLKMIDV